MPLATTSTPALNAVGASAILPVTNAGANQGTTPFPVYAGLPVNGSQLGAYVTPSPDFVGTYLVERHPSGIAAMSDVRMQPVFSGDQTSGSAAPVATLVGLDALSVTLTSWTSGSVMLSVVQ